MLQSSKLLGRTEVLKFYPSKFVLITNILDTFGHLVFDRLVFKANDALAQSDRPRKLPKDFTPEMVCFPFACTTMQRCTRDTIARYATS